MSPYSKSVFITGATGVVGFGVAKKFVHEGFRVKALVRSHGAEKKLLGEGIEVVFGDITCLDDNVEQAMRGCDLVIHSAALHNMLVDDAQLFDQTNFVATKNILCMAERANIPQLLFTSSIKSIGKNPTGGLSDEMVPYNTSAYDSYYGTSKFKAEQFLMEYRGPVKLKFVNPAMVVAAPDEKPTPCGKLIADFINGKMPFYLDTIVNLVNLSDVAEAHHLVYAKGKEKEKYIVSGATLTMKAFFSLLSTMTGTPPPRLKMPFYFLLPAAYVNLFGNRLTGFPLFVHPNSVKMAALKIRYDGSKIARELSLRYTPIEQGLREAVNYFTSVCRSL